MAAQMQNKRSFTGQHTLLPAAEEHRVFRITFVSPHTLFSWTFGRGTVIWRIWPAVLMHTLFATLVTIVSMKTNIYLGIPNVMLTVLGVVIGFVISYRAMSGYDRYWTGRSAWSDIMRNARTFTRLIWFHVPLRLSPRTDAETASEARGERLEMRGRKEVGVVMREKRMALDLVDGFVVALKHHLRSELGIYYEDLYDLVKPFHEHAHGRHHHMMEVHITHEHEHDHNHTDQAHRTLTQSPSQTQPQPQPIPQSLLTPSKPPVSAKASTSTSSLLQTPRDPIIPAINSYGSIAPTPSSSPSLTPTPRPSRHSSTKSKSHLHLLHRHSSTSTSSSSDSDSSSTSHRPLLPASRGEAEDVLGKISGDLIPFGSVFRGVGRVVGRLLHLRIGKDSQDSQGGERDGARQASELGRKHRPRVAGQGENLPLDALRFLSDWTAVLEERGTVPGTSLGSMIGCLAAFEDSLSTLERILTTPLPFVYSVHISTVWIYLIFLPFQLVDQFGWSSIPGTAIAAFIYLGFVAAGEEIEQPFGYDENDLDLDMFCKEIVHADIEKLKRTPCTNVFLGSRHLSARDPLYDGTRSVKQVQGEGEGKGKGGEEVVAGNGNGNGNAEERERERRERREEGRTEGQEMHDHEIEVVIG
ncbi:UPF0187-domain-containing protein [Stereum hirsutum FP-91666 SS1]|uniref:UPF0187-domain-containing protein n=1 Tax=Stereum hirsutum (strain FP-91666) TaxID=721885 RepID=UPI000440A1D2|nr:UPF0187-domain-containing protein [Stereum hirsutum FP-91666 SS1]EIM91945.1 UPF0187-domain-containing protein [Stereum hirsutum FP-91666 SS1]